MYPRPDFRLSSLPAAVLLVIGFLLCLGALYPDAASGGVRALRRAFTVDVSYEPMDPTDDSESTLLADRIDPMERYTRLGTAVNL